MLLGWCRVLFVSTILCIYGVVVAEARHKFVLGIKNGSLFVQDGLSTNSTKSSIASPVETNTVKEDEEVASTPDAATWEEIEKKLDGDLSSVGNADLNAITYADVTEAGKRAQVSNSSNNATSNGSNPLLTRLIEEENILRETEDMIASVRAKKTFSKLADMFTSTFNDSNNNVVTHTNDTGGVSRALDELSSSIRLDCMKLFSMLYSAEGDTMSSNENCLRILGRDIKSNVLQDGNYTKKDVNGGISNKINSSQMNIEKDKNILRNNTNIIEITTREKTYDDNNPSNLSYNTSVFVKGTATEILPNSRPVKNEKESVRKRQITSHQIGRTLKNNREASLLYPHAVYSSMTGKSIKPRKSTQIAHIQTPHLTYEHHLFNQKVRISNRRKKRRSSYKRHVISNISRSLVKRKRTRKEKEERRNRMHNKDYTKRHSKLSKRRLVSNHVPHHKNKDDTKFKTLSEEKKIEKNKTVKPSEQPAQNESVPNTANKQATAQTDNKTAPDEARDEPVKETGNMEQEKQSKTTSEGSDIRPTLSPQSRPTIAAEGIDKTKQGVLQGNSEEKKTEKTDLKHADTDSEYVTDNRYPNLGIFRHAKPHSNDVHDDASTRKTFPNESLVVRNDTTAKKNGDKVAPTTTVKRILCFGDSLTKGAHVKGGMYYPYTRKLRELFDDKKHDNYNIINHGMSGECVSKHMKSRLVDDLETLPKLDLVVILGGTNDLLHEDCARKIDLFDELKKLHTLVHNKGYKSVVVTIPESNVLSNGTDKMTQAEYNDAIDDVNQKLRMYAATEKIPICDLADEFHRYVKSDQVNVAEMWDDKIHPNAKGYDRIGEIIFGDIKEYV